MTNKVAFNPQDRFVTSIGNTLIVTTQNGDVWGHDITGRDVGPAFKFTGARAAFNPQDRFVVTMGNTLIVTTQNGDVWGHDITGRNIGPAFKFTGARAAFNPQDRFVVTIGNKLIVTTQNGDVWGHDITARDIGPAFQFTGAKAAFNPQDRFVVTIGNMLIVTTQNGDVWGHDVNGRDIGPAFQFTGAKAAFNPQDRFVVTIGNMLIVTTQNGEAWGHDVNGRDIGPAFLMNPDRDTATFDSGRVDSKSNLPLSGNIHLVMRRSGDFTITFHVHDSGLNDIEYVISAVLVTASGIGFTFQHTGNVEGFVSGLPFGSPDRDDDFTFTGNNPMITREFDGIISGARLVPELDGKDKLIGGLQEVLGDLIKKAAATAAVVLLA